VGPGPDGVGVAVELPGVASEFGAAGAGAAPTAPTAAVSGCNAAGAGNAGAVAGVGVGAGVTAGDAIIVVAPATCWVSEPMGPDVGSPTVLASPSLAEAFSDLRVVVAGVGLSEAELERPAAIGPLVVLALAPAGSVNVWTGRVAVAAPVASAATRRG
jgi:hypothetical protein